MSRDSIATLADWLSHAERAVAFTGAGISTESGIPDFRSPSGIWSKVQPVFFQDYLRSEESRKEAWRQKVHLFHEFGNAKPNVGHIALARWEKAGRIVGVITQNIDELHQEAGSENVLELHGTARKVVCLRCEQLFPVEPYIEEFAKTEAVPDCPKCGGLLKHATVSFGQTLPEDVLAESMRISQEADLFLAIGSSLVVYPAAGLPEIALRAGSKLVIINRDPTPYDDQADLVIRVPIGECLGAVDEFLK
jgi:NAD-dependent deacetylase